MESYLSLPTRNKPKAAVLTNVYEVRAERLPTRYFLYAANEPLTKRLRSWVVKQGKENAEGLCQKIGFICFYKQGLLGNKKTEETLTLQINESKV
jgi:hypothetical protein